jgi:glycosyltransferase involved in cell wall biosynthesis
MPAPTVTDGGQPQPGTPDPEGRPTRRLLAVAPVTHAGGAETGLLRLLSRLQSRGWHVTLTTPGGGPLRDAALDAGHDWTALGVGGLAPGTGAPAVASWARIRRLARAAGVVYLNGSVCGRLLPALSASGARRVLHVHDIVSRVPRFWRLADVVLADSGAVASELHGLRSHIVYCPVEADPPLAEAPWPVTDGPVVGFVGRIEPRKGPLDLVRAAAAIRRSHPAARVVVVGEDPYGSDPAYTRQVIQAPEVEHVPWIGNAPGLMRNLDVLVLPSYQEPFGTVLAEAMAVGTPVVATRVGGLPEVVQDGVTGRLVPPGDPEQLAAAVIEVLARRDSMGAAAHEGAKRFYADAYADRVERLIAG